MLIAQCSNIAQKNAKDCKFCLCSGDNSHIANTEKKKKRIAYTGSATKHDLTHRML